MPKECAVCKQPAVVAARATRGEQVATIYLCENCSRRLSYKVRLEIIQSVDSSIPPGTVLDNTNTVSQSTNANSTDTPVRTKTSNHSDIQKSNKQQGKKNSIKRVPFTISLVLLAVCVLIGAGFLVKHFSKKEVSWSAVNPLEVFEPVEMFPLKPSIEETILYEQNGIRITAKEISYTSFSAKLSLLLENNTDTDLEFYSNTLAYACNSVNGYMVQSGYINEDVQAHSSVETTATFSSDDLYLLNITDIADLEIGFMIHDDDYNYIYTGPCPLKTTLAPTYDYSSPSHVKGVTNPWISHEYKITVESTLDSILYDANEIRVDKGVILKNSEKHLLITLEAQNNSDKIIRFSVENLAINDLITYLGSWTSRTINPGKTAV